MADAAAGKRSGGGTASDPDILAHSNLRQTGRRLSVSLDGSGQQVEVDTGELNAVAKLLSTDRIVEQKARAVRRRADERRRRRKGMDKVAKRNDKIQELFQTFDIDGDGTIDEIEFGEVIRFLRIPIPPENITRTFMTIDTDGTGSISLREFQTWYNGDGKTLIKQNGLERFRMNLRDLSEPARKARDMTVAKYEILRENFRRQRQVLKDQERAKRELEEAKRLAEEAEAEAKRMEELEDLALEADAALLDEDDHLEGHLDDLDSDDDGESGSHGSGVENSASTPHEAKNPSQPEWRQRRHNYLMGPDVRHILTRVNSVPYSGLVLQVSGRQQRSRDKDESDHETELEAEDDDNDDREDESKQESDFPFRLRILLKTTHPSEAATLAAVAEYCDAASKGDEPPKPLIVLLKTSATFFHPAAVLGLAAGGGGGVSTVASGATEVAASSAAPGIGAGFTGDFVSWRAVCHVPAALLHHELAVFLRAYRYLVSDPELRNFVAGTTAFGMSGVPYMRDFGALAGTGSFTGLRGEPHAGGDGGQALREIRLGLALRSSEIAEPLTHDDAVDASGANHTQVKSVSGGNSTVFAREADLLQLHELLVSGDGPRSDGRGVVVIAGSSGVGKAAVVSAYARVASFRFPLGVYTIRLDNPFEREASVRDTVVKLETLFPGAFGSRVEVGTADSDKIASVSESQAPAVRSHGAAVDDLTPAERTLLHHLHTTAGWLLVLPNIQSSAQLQEFLGRWDLIDRCRAGCGSVVATTALAPADFGEYTSAAGDESDYKPAMFRIQRLSSFSRQEGSAFLLGCVYSFFPSMSPQPSTNSDTDGADAAEAAAVHSANMVGAACKRIVKLARNSPCALKVCVDGIAQVLRRQQQERVPEVKLVGSDSDDEENEGNDEVEQNTSRHLLACSEADVAAALEEYADHLDGAAAGLSSPRTGSLVAVEVAAALAANTAILKAGFPKQWKQASLVLQLCAAVRNRRVPLSLAAQFLAGAAEVLSGKAPSARGTAKAEIQALRVVGLLEASGLLVTRCHFGAPEPQGDHPNAPGSAGTALRLDSTVLFFNHAIHEALGHLIETKVKLLPVIAGLFHDTYRGAVAAALGSSSGVPPRDTGEGDVSLRSGNRLVTPEGCLSALHTPFSAPQATSRQKRNRGKSSNNGQREKSAPVVGGEVASLAVAESIAHLHALLSKHRVSKIQIKRSLDDFLHYFLDLGLFATELHAAELAQEYFDQVCHWVGYAPDKPSKKEAATGMIPRAAALHRHMAFVAHRQRISLLAADRNFDAALGQCRELHQLLRLGAQGAAAMRKHGNLSEDGGGGEPKFFTHDPELGALLLAASLLEADLRWRMHSWEPCYAAYDKVMATPAKAGKTVKPGLTSYPPDSVAARVTYRMGFIRLHRVFRRSASVSARQQTLKRGGPDDAKIHEVEAAAELVQRSLALQQAVYGGAVARFETGLALHALGNALTLLLPSPVKALGIIEQALAMFQRLLAQLGSKPSIVLNAGAHKQEQTANQAASAVAMLAPETAFSEANLARGAELQRLGIDWTLADLVVAIGHVYYDLGVHFLGGAPLPKLQTVKEITEESEETKEQALSNELSRREQAAAAVVSAGAAALPYFRSCLEHLLLVKNDPSVASFCSRGVQRAHERIKQCYVAFFENPVPTRVQDAASSLEKEGSSARSGRLTGRALLREIIRLHPVVHSPQGKVRALAVRTARRNSKSLAGPGQTTSAFSPTTGDAQLIVCEVDDLRLQWIRRHLKQAAYLRFTDLSSLIKKCRAIHRKEQRDREESGTSPTATKSGLVIPRRNFNGITLPELQRVVRVELDVPARMVTDDEIANIFHYVSQGGEGIEYGELLRFLVDEELLKKIHFKLQAATYKFGGRDLENEVFRRQDGDGSGQLDFPEFVSLFRKVLRLTPQECSDIDIRTVFEYMGGSYLAGVQQERFKEFLDEDFELDFISRRLKARKWHIPSADELLGSGLQECMKLNRSIVKLRPSNGPGSNSSGRSKSAKVKRKKSNKSGSSSSSNSNTPHRRHSNSKSDSVGSSRHRRTRSGSARGSDTRGVAARRRSSGGKLASTRTPTRSRDSSRGPPASNTKAKGNGSSKPPRSRSRSASEPSGAATSSKGDSKHKVRRSSGSGASSRGSNSSRSSSKLSDETLEQGSGGTPSTSERPQALPATSSKLTASQCVLEFFEAHHPKKLHEVPAVLSKFRGKERKLLRTIVKLYGDTAKEFFEANGFKVKMKDSGK